MLRRAQRYIAGMAIGLALAGAMACGLGRPAFWQRSGSDQPAANLSQQPSSGPFSLKAIHRLIDRAIATSGGIRHWREIEGLELEMVWKTYEGARIVEDPALVQIATTAQPQIRVHYSKLDQVIALGDKGPWAMLRGQPDRNASIVDRAHYTAATIQFFLSLPFNLKDRGIVIRGAETKIYGGQVFDTVTMGFRGGSYPWQADAMTLWFQRPNALLVRCFWVSTAKGSDIGPPPNYLMITWENHVSLSDIPLARRWSFFRAESDGTMKEKRFDIEVTSAVANRSFMPVLFREPVIEPRIQRLPVVGGEKTTPTLPTPTP